MQLGRAVLTATGVLVAGAATVAAPRRRQLVARLLRLPPPHQQVDVEHDLWVRMPDGAALATDVYHPRGVGPGPTVLIRTPYGRRRWSGALSVTLARRFAERGYRVVAQDVRGRFESRSGEFEPYLHEGRDAAATAEWITAQPWSDGQVATWGPSYLGYVQWALAAAEGPHPAAMVPITTAANPLGAGAEAGPGIDTTLRWIIFIDAMENTDLRLWTRLARIAVAPVQHRLLASGFGELPLAGADVAVLGRESSIWRRWVEHAHPGDELWEQVDVSAAITRTPAKVHAVTGWFDIYLTRQLEDHARLVAAGRRPYLTIGPWHHLDPRMQLAGLRIGLDWFDTHLRGRPGKLRDAPVRVWVSGEWRDLDAWPPPTTDVRCWLHPGGTLGDGPPDGEPAPTTYRYDPARPTPGIGGAMLSMSAGSVDNTPLEARDDVLTFTTEPLAEAVEVMGEPCARLSVSATSPHVDLVTRLCVVRQGGRSFNLSDGHVRLGATRDDRDRADLATPDDDRGVLAVDVPMSALAHRFAPGERIRLQVASGAHPRIARNLGTGESPLHGTTMRQVDVAVHHDGTHPSWLDLPVSSAE